MKCVLPKCMKYFSESTKAERNKELIDPFDPPRFSLSLSLSLYLNFEFFHSHFHLLLSSFAAPFLYKKQRIYKNILIK